MDARETVARLIASEQWKAKDAGFTWATFSPEFDKSVETADRILAALKEIGWEEIKEISNAKNNQND